MKVHVLDANALYRFLTGGPGADMVGRLFREGRDAEQPLRMSVVNWGEVYYTIARARDSERRARSWTASRCFRLRFSTRTNP